MPLGSKDARTVGCWENDGKICCSFWTLNTLRKSIHFDVAHASVFSWNQLLPLIWGAWKIWLKTHPSSTSFALGPPAAPGCSQAAPRPLGGLTSQTLAGDVRHSHEHCLWIGLYIFYIRTQTHIYVSIYNWYSADDLYERRCTIIYENHWKPTCVKWAFQQTTFLGWNSRGNLSISLPPFVKF